MQELGVSQKLREMAMQRVWKTLIAAEFIGALAVSGCTGSESPGQYLDDALITSKVSSRIAEDAELEDATIDVRTEQGVVWLSGVVETKKLKTRAIKLATSVEGVKKVKAPQLVIVQ